MAAWCGVLSPGRNDGIMKTALPGRLAVPLGVLLAVALAGLAGIVLSSGSKDPARTIGPGRVLYVTHCAACHGNNLEGQPNWQTPLPDGRLPAPPHDATGHTWHHADDVLIGITKQGLRPYVPQGYESSMPAFAGMLTDDEIAVLWDYIKSTWPERERTRQEIITERSRSLSAAQ